MYRSVLFVFLICVLGCKNVQNKNAVPHINGEEISFYTLISGSHSNYKDEISKAINTEEELLTVFQVLNSTRKPGINIPEIDFKSTTVFFYASKELSYGGAPIQIERVIKTQNGIRVIPVVNKIDPLQPVTTVMSSPFVMITIPKTDLPIQFK